jgi:hypothetical protein
VIEDNVNPLYYEVVELEYEVRDINDLESYPPFIFDLFDQDNELLNSNGQYLARAIITPKECAIVLPKDYETCKQHTQKSCQYCTFERKDNEVPKTPKWHPLRYAVGEPISGEVLVSFSVSTYDYNYVFEPQAVDLRARVEFKEYEVNMLILGLRALQSPGILPVKKAFIQFNVKSLVPPNISAI